MGKIKSVKFNFLMNGILALSTVLFPLITSPYVLRIIGPEKNGTLSFANAVITYFSMFAQLGVPTYGVRVCAEARDDREKLSRTVHEIFMINLVTCLCAYLLFGLALATVPQIREERTLFLVMSTLILLNTIGMEWMYKGLEQYGYITVRSIGFKLLALIAMFLLIHEREDYVIYGGISIFAACGSNLLNFINLRKYISLRPLGGYHFRRHIRPISVFFAMAVATTVYTNMDSVMLRLMRGATENGYYDVAVRIKNILVSVVASLGTVLLPRVSYYVEKGEWEEFLRMVKKAFRFVLLFSVPLCVYFMMFAGPCIDFLYGVQFLNSVPAMQVIMPTLVFIGITNIIGIQMLVPLGRENEVLYSEIAGAVVNVAVNLALIPAFGSVGAAAGTVAAELTVLVVQVVCLRDLVLPIARRLPYGKFAAALAGGSFFAFLVSRLSVGSFAELALSALVFFGVYAGLLLLLREQMAWEVVDLVKKRF